MQEQRNSWRPTCAVRSWRERMSSYGTFGTTITRSLWPTRHYDTRSAACSYSVLKPLAPSSSPCSPPPDLPIVYRCSLLADGNGLQGVRLGPSSCEQEVVVKEVFSETVSEICRIRPGDIVTHANGAEVKGSWQVVQDACNSCHGVVELRLMRGKSGLCELDEYGRLVSGGSKLLRRSPVFFYEVHSCDTLQHIAAAFDTTQEVIRKDNRGVFEAGVKANLEAGQLLKIRNAHLVESAGNDEDSRHISSSSHEDPSMLKRHYHEVREGETLDQIAQQHGISVTDVRKYNRWAFPVGDRGMLIPGMRLVVYEKVEGKASAS